MTTSSELLLVGIVRALVEVAGLSLLGQGALYVLAGAGRERNPIYRLLHLIASPAVKTVHRLAPQWIADRHVPVLTFFLLLWLWFALAYVRRELCVAGGPVC